ncbi:MAG: TetR/AcrR family transcriptional regulator [Desulfurellaceae bacterium]|nr:TetR/AcrR family transcriptional regulator [Desulfurellaceae bacterium]
MSDIETKIVEAAIRTFVRYGARKTAMADIAQEAKVSRQTLYDVFGSKDQLIVASVRHITDHNLSQVEARLGACESLEAQLDVYFAETIIKSFELLQTSGDAEDLISGHNEAGRDALAESHARHTKLITRLLSPYTKQIEASGQSLNQFAHFFVTAAMAFKYSAKSRRDLNGLISSLKTAVTLVANQTTRSGKSTRGA